MNEEFIAVGTPRPARGCDRGIQGRLDILVAPSATAKRVGHGRLSVLYEISRSGLCLICKLFADRAEPVALKIADRYEQPRDKADCDRSDRKAKRIADGSGAGLREFCFHLVRRGKACLRLSHRIANGRTRA